MKKSISSSLCAVAIMACASLSWGSQIFVDSYAENFLITDNGAGVSLGATRSTTADLATANTNGSWVFVGSDTQVGPNATSALGSIATVNTLIEGRSKVLEGSISIAASSPSSSIWAMASGSISIDPWATTNPLAPSEARLQTLAVFEQDFTTTSNGNIAIDWDIRSFWQGDATTSISRYRWFYTLTDNNGVPIDAQQSGTAADAGWLAYLPQNKGVDILTTHTSNVNLDIGTHTVTWQVELDAADPVSNTVPEPGTFVLAGSGLLALFFHRRLARKCA